jgi:hypothetical protein
MNRNHLINRLVARKMEANRPVKAFCEFYMASPARKFYEFATNQPAAANPKS